MNQKPDSAQAWRSRIERCKTKRRDLVPAWAENVDYLRGKPFDVESDEDRIYVNQDWPLARRKVSQLASQVPEVKLVAKADQFKPAVPGFSKVLNDTLKAANIGDALHEVAKDCVNAAGIGAVIVGFDRRTEKVKVPAIDLSTIPPEMQAVMLQSGQVPMAEVERTTSERFYSERISPSDLLWPVEFTGSNFDQGPWMGHSGRMTWAESKHAFNLNDEQKEDVLGTGSTDSNYQENLRGTLDDGQHQEPSVSYDEVFYWRYRFDPSEKYFKSIWRIVFVNGIDQPVIHEPWKGQRFDPNTGDYAGSCKFPIRVLTLSYVSDDPIPPSDSAIGRPQVNELIRSRSQMILQRDRVAPLRWADVNRVDPAVLDNLMRGTWQGIVPVQGSGNTAIGEVARASYPAEEYGFDRIVKSDLQEEWSVGANQVGNFASGERSAAEAGIVQQNFQTQLGFERARVATFFVGIAEVMGGLLALYGDFKILGQDEIQRIDASWDRSRIASDVAYSVLPDSTAMLDSGQRIQRNLQTLNMLGKSGLIDPTPLIEEILMLSGHDPVKVMRKPEPSRPEAPNLSLKGDDLINPLAVAILMRAGLTPSPEEMTAAQKMIQAAIQPPPPEPLMSMQEGVQEVPPVQPNPDWALMPKVAARSEEI